MEHDVVVKKSKIHEKGVFANRAFKKGQIVMKWDTSKLLTKEEADNLPEKEKRYISPFKGKILLQQPPARYVNHSCDPNTKVAGNSSDVAIKDIKKGEEITSDYSVFFVPGETMECHCGAKKCKGIVRTAQKFVVSSIQA